MASANILAQRGDQQACESTLSSARDIHSTDAADLRSGEVSRIGVSAWRRQQKRQKVNAYWVAHLAP